MWGACADLASCLLFQYLESTLARVGVSGAPRAEASSGTMGGHPASRTGDQGSRTGEPAAGARASASRGGESYRPRRGEARKSDLYPDGENPRPSVVEGQGGDRHGDSRRGSRRDSQYSTPALRPLVSILSRIYLACGRFRTEERIGYRTTTLLPIPTLALLVLLPVLAVQLLVGPSHSSTSPSPCICASSQCTVSH